MLEIDSLRKSYGAREVLDSVSMSVPMGSVTGLLGPNGSGKSTLLHIVVGLIKATSGRVTFGDLPASDSAVRRAIGFCPDDLPLPELLTAREYLTLIEGIRGMRSNEVAIDYMSSGLRIAAHLDALVGTYSHGMKRKLQLIAALLHRPTLLILDEPFRGLDPESGAIMRTLVTRYAAEGNAVLISTHDLALAGRLCRNVVVLQDGQVRASGELAHVVGTHADLESSFLAYTGLDVEAEDAADEFFAGLEVLEGA
ncbi:MAG TPA: ABC transporter ATP-binding protein [Pseudolysinimonas sp.]|nr:ABC transporter ATP-binding protein [Pseudolysinimonas sp.]